MLLATALSLALLAPSVPPPGIDDAPVVEAGPEGFEKALEEVATALRRRRWSDAEELILAALDVHAGADYVRPHLPALREDVRRAAFWKDVDEPDPESLVDGELLSYSARTGRIKIRFTRTTMGDFEREGAAFVHPMAFSGPWSLAVKGSADEVAAITYLLLKSPDDGYLVRFGKHSVEDVLYSLHVVQRLGKPLPLVSESPPARKKTSDLEGRLEIGKASLRGVYDRKRAFEADFVEEAPTRFALVAESEKARLGDFGTLTVEGTVDDGWISGLLDAAVGDQRAAFDAGWSDPPQFDAWEAEVATEVEDVSWQTLLSRMKFVIPGKKHQQENLGRMREAVEGGRGTAVLKQLETLPEEALSPEGIEYVRLMCALGLNRHALGLESLEAVRIAEGSEFDAALLRALLLRGAGRIAEEEELLRELVAEHPTSSLAHAQRVSALLLLRRPEAAREAVLAARELLPGSARLRDVESQVFKAEKGPSWERVLEEPGEHFVVRFDGSRRIAKRARDAMDEAWKRCEEFFGPLESEPEGPCRVFLFSGERSYLTYVENVGDSSPERTLGVYEPSLEQIAAWNQPDAERLLDTLRHECAHRYIDLKYGYTFPRWLNEGLAESFAAAFESGSWEPGAMRPEQLDVFNDSVRLITLEALMRSNVTTFMEDASVGYALAWAFVHYLQFVGEGERPILDRLLAALADGATQQQAVDAALEDVDLSKLQDRFMKWLNRTVGKHRRGR